MTRVGKYSDAWRSLASPVVDLPVRLPISRATPRLRNLRSGHAGRNLRVAGLSSLAVYAAQILNGQQEPGAGSYGILRCRPVGMHFGELYLSAWEALVSCPQEPLHGLSAVTDDRAVVVVQTVVVEDAEIELRTGVALLGCEKQALSDVRPPNLISFHERPFSHLMWRRKL